MVSATRLVSVFILLAAAGCTSGGQSPKAVGPDNRTSPTVGPCKGEVPPETSHPNTKLLVSLAIDVDTVEGLSLWGDKFGYATDRNAFVCDMGSGQVEIVDRAPEGWGIGSIVGDRDVIVVTRVRTLGTEERPLLAWEIRLHREGKARTIRSQDPVSGRYDTDAKPSIEWPYVVWTELPREGDVGAAGPNVVVYDLRDNSVRVLASGQFPLEAAVTDGHVFFTAKTASTGSRDVYVQAADGRTPLRKVTSSRNDAVTSVQGSSGWITWGAYPLRPNEPVGDIPWFAVEADPSGTPKKVAEGVHAAPGDGFVVYGANDLRVVPVEGGSVPSEGFAVAGAGYAFAPRWVARGSRIAFGEVLDYLGARKQSFIRVVELRA